MSSVPKNIDPDEPIEPIKNAASEDRNGVAIPTGPIGEDTDTGSDEAAQAAAL